MHLNTTNSYVTMMQECPCTAYDYYCGLGLLTGEEFAKLPQQTIHHIPVGTALGGGFHVPGQLANFYMTGTSELTGTS